MTKAFAKALTLELLCKWNIPLHDSIRHLRAFFIFPVGRGFDGRLIVYRILMVNDETVIDRIRSITESNIGYFQFWARNPFTDEISPLIDLLLVRPVDTTEGSWRSAQAMHGA